MDEFVEAVRSTIESNYGVGYNVSINPSTKNNGVQLTGIVIQNEKINIAPNIYLEDLYEEYQNGLSLEDACKKVMDFYEKTKAVQDFDVTTITDFDQVKDKICFKLINAEKNINLLRMIPFIPYQDLVIVFYVLVSRDCEGTASMLIKDNFLDVWGTNSQELYHIAMENTQRIFSGRVVSMQSIIEETMEELLKSPENLQDMPENTEGLIPMYVATNCDRYNGASVLLYSDLLRDFAEHVDSDFYILPSSIHELIFLPYDEEMNIVKIKATVQDVNSRAVEEKEFLSNNVYLYSREKDCVKIIK